MTDTSKKTRVENLLTIFSETDKIILCAFANNETHVDKGVMVKKIESLFKKKNKVVTLRQIEDKIKSLNANGYLKEQITNYGKYLPSKEVHALFYRYSFEFFTEDERKNFEINRKDNLKLDFWKALITGDYWSLSLTKRGTFAEYDNQLILSYMDLIADMLQAREETENKGETWSLPDEFWHVLAGTLREIISKHMILGNDETKIIKLLKSKKNPTVQRNFVDVFAEYAFFTGGEKALEKQISNIEDKDSYTFKYYSALSAFAQNDAAVCVKLFESALKDKRAELNNRYFFPPDSSILLILVGFWQSQKIPTVKKAKDWIDNLMQHFHYVKPAQLLSNTIFEKALAPTKNVDAYLKFNSLEPVMTFWRAFAVYASNGSSKFNPSAEMETAALLLAQSNEIYFLRELAYLYQAIHGSDKLIVQYQSRFADFQSVLLCDRVQLKSDWEEKLSMLEIIALGGKKSSDKEGASRIAWIINLDKRNVQPVEQKLSKNGWTAGKNIALKRIYLKEHPAMSVADIQAAAGIEFYRDSYYYAGTYEVDFEKAIIALIGHPYIFDEISRAPFEIVKGEHEIYIEKNAKGYQIKLSNIVNQAGSSYEAETPTRIRVFQTSEAYAQISNTFPNGFLQLPVDAKDTLAKLTAHLSKIAVVHSALAKDGGEAVNVKPEEILHLHILPQGEQFKVFLLVRPLGEGNSYLKPGKGNAVAYGTQNDKKVSAQRNLKEESKKATQIIKKSRILSESDNDSCEFLIESAEQCLEFMLEADEMKDDVVIAWPEGVKLKLAGKASFKNVYLRVKESTDWFSVDGEVKVGEESIALQSLLTALADSKNKFIKLDNDKFLAITDELRKRLNELQSYTETDKKGLKFHKLSAYAFDDLTQEIEHLKADKQWQEHITRLQSVKNIVPVVPPTFQAELREYQKDGFNWLYRLSEWGVGACLADDMGLGKTIQALALLVNRAEKGAALVIAPASVTRNWLNECKKFAPTLNPILLAAKDREEVIKNLQPYDLLICSYGLLQQDIDFSAQKFGTVVLDEAQYIKNMNTKRSKNAMELNADFKIITTGTPVENHLGELWNLFRFLNPGLLGSLEKFNEKFAVPIEKHSDKERRKQLQKLLKPFILRRKKNQVLDELPSKTEITLEVELSEQETALYEVMRRQSVDKISQTNDTDRRFTILAEITKLRRLCCNPKLVLPDTEISSSKLKILSDLVDELREGGHKALIFSQFVTHLAIIRELMEKKNIPFQYLDGSTPLNQRQEAVNDFQRGKGDVFLISLKAGGVGLNLTAADYVIHTDPWWNPAVEDQASDRAHRIGQQRPVTIYRLVTKGTIEDKIVALHAEKRELADSLLDGTDASARMNTEQLLALMLEK